jgi:arabinose-5-phosphate isomerase
VITGMGKSGLIGQKIAATMASTGTPALFLHPAEGVHGDLGMIMRGDVVIAISNSGETDELLRILPAVKRLGACLIAMSGSRASTLGRAGDVFVNIAVGEEACPLGLAPTSSATATLAMGDALAICVLLKRGFRAEDYAILHPGGSLGRRLLLTVDDLMHSGDALPLLAETAPMREAILVISAKRLGVTGVVDAEGRLTGVITDGDLRRALAKWGDFLDRPAGEVMTRQPKRILRGELAARALQRMEEHVITSLFVFESEGEQKPIGIIHVHDLLKAGIA